MKRFTLSLILIIVMLLLAACGFQPRGQALNLSSIAGPIYISGVAQFSPLHRELGQQLKKSGASLTSNSNNAKSLLTLRNQSSDERLLSVDSRNRGVEYELEESVQFSLRSNNQGEIASPQTVRVVRILFRPQDQILASEREENQLRIDMQHDLARRIVKRLAAQQ